jgi:hypothetical protein
MKSGLIAILFLAILFSCHTKKPQPKSVEDALKNTMQEYLYKSVNNDTSVKYTVEKVIFYADTSKYICNFTVNVHVSSKNFDTTGIMKANISKDFSKVDRTQ